MIKLNKGTKEHIQVDVSDRLNTLTTLTGTNPTFSTRKRYALNWIQQDQAAVNIGLTAFCLIDTTLAAYGTDIHELFIKFTSLPEVPVLGPFDFQIDP